MGVVEKERSGGKRKRKEEKGGIVTLCKRGRIFVEEHGSKKSKMGAAR